MDRYRKRPWCLILLGLVIFALLLITGANSAPDCFNSTIFLNRPIPLGVSGGNENDISKLFCCSGTLGALVQDTAGAQYILSNNHVLARTNKGQPGDPIIQPGLVDSGCAQLSQDEVATLTAFVPINFSKGAINQVDAAVAEVVPGDVKTDGTINCIGPIGSTPVAATVGLQVQKSGRTTELTFGTVAATNATLSVKYNKTCGFGSQTAVFTKQFRIDGSSFSAGGDSGSLIVTQDACPQPVGLLFAGSNTTTFANPIDLVLSQLSQLPAFKNNTLSVTMVGGCTSKSSAATAVAAASGEASDLEKAKGVQARHEHALMAIDGVVGVGIGLSEDGTTHVIEVYVKKHTPEIEGKLPKQLDGVKVRIVETGEIRAL